MRTTESIKDRHRRYLDELQEEIKRLAQASTEMRAALSEYHDNCQSASPMTTWPGDIDDARQAVENATADIQQAKELIREATAKLSA